MSDCKITLGEIWPNDLYFVVPGEYISPGGNIITLPGAFKGWRIRLIRNNIPVDYGDQGFGDPYFTQDEETNTVALSADAVAGEKFMVQAYKPYR